MSDHYFPVPSASEDLVVQKLPPAFRVCSIERYPHGDAGVLSRAALYHDAASLSVEWSDRHADNRIVAGALVSIRWRGRPTSIGGAVNIARLAVLERPMPSLNLFATVLPSWVRDRALLKRAAKLWEALPLPYRHLLNAIFWDDNRFHRFVMGPSSLNGHHNDREGNLRHSVEVAERALALAAGDPVVCEEALILAALLHDAGKADEYRLANRRLVLSDRGRLIGHRTTVIEWVAAACAKHNVDIPHDHRLALIHILSSAKGAPLWLGLREPQSLEAKLLSMADRASGEGELIRRHAPKSTGFGQYHRHLGMQPYVIVSGASEHL
ncbi:metal-dependent phosphohydrolase [Parazoarcus communis]|uniref:Metal-dependent phosphohydrolase n=1 Tax=Parazoarcus communis TaxID=41977 RepID=A0A2U8H347_9RHOO|nr:HD domain-containing protein [Parazoarcus communis]AWI79165.1 metal-dependent phosphohydrolase [Parazoarcus communis]